MIYNLERGVKHFPVSIVHGAFQMAILGKSIGMVPKLRPDKQRAGKSPQDRKIIGKS